MTRLVERIRDNVQRLRSDIADLCASCNRAPDSVTLCAVSKYATTIETAAIAHALHQLTLPVLLGESRVQDLAPKSAELASEDLPIQWELIGTLQRNKARQALAVVRRIHSLDRIAILDVVSRIACESGVEVEGFLQVKTSPEDEKNGFDAADLDAALAHASELTNLRITGLMTMAPRGTDHESARPYFARLRELRDAHAPDLPHLSMGMSGDWHGAVLEGATILRVGSALHASG